MNQDEIMMNISNIAEYGVALQGLSIQTGLAAMASSEIFTILAEDSMSELEGVQCYKGYAGDELLMYFKSLTAHLEKISTLYSVCCEYTGVCIQKMAESDAEIAAMIEQYFNEGGS